ncbi:MAG: putative sporulation protein YtxC [Sulfobacillus thermotolerans]|nr:putative sporulation protein YtxC [Sulfobacillus thermotolerans]
MSQWTVTTDHPVMAEGLGEFLARSIPGQWTESRQGRQVAYTLQGEGEDNARFAWPMARALAQYILIYHERDWLDELLVRRYHTFEQHEHQQIVKDVLKLLHVDREQDVGRLDLASTLIFSYVESHATLVVEGIRTFLLPEIRAEFEEAIDQALDIFLMEQEYQEFVRLLRQLVQVAGHSMEWIHVRFQRNQFFFEDGAGERIGEELVSEMLEGMDRDQGALDDVLISALVTLAPARITIHRGRLHAEGKETLKQVFDGKVLFCRGCARCYSREIDTDWRSF